MSAAPRLKPASMADDEYEEGPVAEDDESDGMEAFDAFADAIGLAEDKRAEAYTAFCAAVAAAKG